MMPTMQTLFVQPALPTITYAVWDTTHGSDINLSSDGLTATSTTGGLGTSQIRVNLSKSTGKWYFECNIGDQQAFSGISNSSHNITTNPILALQGDGGNSMAIRFFNGGANQWQIWWDGGTIASATPNKSAGIYGYELDSGAMTLAVRDSTGIFATMNFSTGGSPVSGPWYFSLFFQNSSSAVLNSGLTQFTYTSTSGFNQGLYV